MHEWNMWFFLLEFMDLNNQNRNIENHAIIDLLNCLLLLDPIRVVHVKSWNVIPFVRLSFIFAIRKSIKFWIDWQHFNITLIESTKPLLNDWRTTLSVSCHKFTFVVIRPKRMAFIFHVNYSNDNLLVSFRVPNVNNFGGFV